MSSSSRPRTRKQKAAEHLNNSVESKKNKNQASVKIEQDDDNYYLPVNSGLVDVKIELDGSLLYSYSNVVSVDKSSVELDLTDGNFNFNDEVEVEESLGNEIVMRDINDLENVRNSGFGNVGEETNGFEVGNGLSQVDVVVNDSDSGNSRNSVGTNNYEDLSGEVALNGCGLKRSSRLGSVSNVGVVCEKTNLVDVFEVAKDLPRVDVVVNDSDLDNSDGTNNYEHLSGEIALDGCASKRQSLRLGSVSNVGEKANLVDVFEVVGALSEVDVVVNNPNLDYSRNSGGTNSDEHLSGEIVSKGCGSKRSSRLGSVSNVGDVGERANLDDVFEVVSDLPQVDVVVNNSDLDNSKNSDGANSDEHLSGEIFSNGCGSERSSGLGSVSNVGVVGEKTNLVDVVEEQAFSQVDCHLFDVVVDDSGLNNLSRDLDGAEHLVVEIVSDGSEMGRRRSARLRSLPSVGYREGETDFVDLVANTLDSDNSGQNSDESDGEAEHLGRDNVPNGLGKRGSSRLGSALNVRNGDKKTNIVDYFDLVSNTSDSDDSGRNLDGSDGENERVGSTNDSEGASLERSGSALNVGNIDENVNELDSFNLVANTSDSDNLGDGSDSDQSIDPESSSDEEDTDDSNSELTGVKSDDSDDSDYVTGDIRYYSNKKGTNGKSGSSQADIKGGKALRIGRKVKRMQFSGGVSKDDCYYSNKSGLKKRKRQGLEILVHFGEISETELRSFSFQKKDGSLIGKNTRPSPMIDGDKSDSPTDDEYETLRRELCGRQKKGESGKKAVRKYTKKKNSAARSNDLINILVDSIKNPTEGSDTKVHEPLPLKFKFVDDVDPPREKSEAEKENDMLFLDMDLALRASQIDDSADKKVDEDPMSTETDKSGSGCCGESILDEQIGMICGTCGAILVDIKDILPPWYTPTWKQNNKKEFLESLWSKVGKFQFKDLGNGRQGSVTATNGNITVWDLIPGVEKDMFPHQCEGFEFLWKNIAGDIRIEKLPKTLPDDSKGCIISHAPGTGKTRLTIVFLMSFLMRYPNAKPVIVAPCGMLDTWEDEFIKWKVNIPFHKMSSDLSANEIQLAADKAGWQMETSGRMNKEDARLVKLFSWISSGGVLGISYQLFGRLASKCKKGEKEGVIWKTLVEKPGILILDEGHTPRNSGSNIWKALRKVATQRRIILSGTPFQNNVTELYNTFCLIDPKFLKIDKATWKELSESTNFKNLRDMLDPYVHLHKGTILQQSIPGLRETIVFLRPPELQKVLLEAARKVKIFLTRSRLVSLISVHPSMALTVAEITNFFKNRTFSLHKDELKKVESNVDAGVKMQFVINLIQLADALGERVLIFSQYLYPLVFIKQQLIASFSWREGREVLYMDGQLDMKKRQESISALNNTSSEAKVLLASEKACSEGINLVGASRVVLLDTVWNPSVERQAISRAYRLGQTKMVYVYRLIISGMEIRQYELQAQKDHISDMIFSPIDGRVRKAETSGVVSEDKVLEQMLSLKSCGHSIEKIVRQPKECGLLETFGFVES